MKISRETPESRDFYYPFCAKKLRSTSVLVREGDVVLRKNLGQVLGDALFEQLQNSSVYTKRGLISDYVRVCEYNAHQLQMTKQGAGSGRATTPTKTGRGVSRLPRATISGRRRAVSNIPQAVKGRRAHRIILNATKLSMNLRAKQAARQSILYHLLRTARLILLPEEVVRAKTAVLERHLQKLNMRRGLRRVLIMRSEPGMRSTSNTRAILLDQNHHSLYAIGTHFDRDVLLTADGLRDLVLRVFNGRKLGK